MDKYSIYCTEKQTEKALKLGAPIRRALFPSTWFEEVYPKRCHIDISENPNGCTLAIPTAEQMIGWIRSKSIKFHFDDDTNYWRVSIDAEPISIGFGYNKDKELAAIDAALDYLIKTRK